MVHFFYFFNNKKKFKKILDNFEGTLIFVP
jgi:hypothetical protein